MKNRKIICTFFTVALISIISFGVYKWFIEGALRLDTIIFFALITAYLFNYIANGKSDIEDQDEREVYLSKKASGLSYMILVVCLGVILVLTEGTAMLPEFNNIPLVVCFSLSIVIYPMVPISFLQMRLTPSVAFMAEEQ